MVATLSKNGFVFAAHRAAAEQNTKDDDRAKWQYEENTVIPVNTATETVAKIARQVKNMPDDTKQLK